MPTIEGLEELTQNLENLGVNVERELPRIAKRAMTQRVERRAKETCPVGQSRPGYTGGRLRTSIATQIVRTDAGSEIRTGTNVEYAPFVEYGTGWRGASVGAPHPDDYIFGPKPGMLPRPYLRPAWDRLQETVMDDIEADLQALVEEAARK